MTGGRHERWRVETRHPFYLPRPRTLLQVEMATDEVLELWARAAEFRRRVNRLLRTHGATLSQWRMLHAAERLVEESDEMVSQLEIARRAKMDANTASALTFRLGERVG
jgi:hypothetical protein